MNRYFDPNAEIHEPSNRPVSTTKPSQNPPESTRLTKSFPFFLNKKVAHTKKVISFSSSGIQPTHIIWLKIHPKDLTRGKSCGCGTPLLIVISHKRSIGILLDFQ